MTLPVDATSLPATAGPIRRARWLANAALRLLRSSDMAPILVCALGGALIGVLVGGLHRLVDRLHTVIFRLPQGIFLSTGIGIDPARMIFVPVLGGLVLGLGALAVRRFHAKEVVDPVEANA